MKAITIVLSITVLFLEVISCSTSNGNNQIQISLIRKNDSLHYVQIETDSSLDKWELPYSVYQFQIGDIDNNGKDDMLIGVVKTTRFDSTMRKRLFIFKNYKGLVRPLWLGSRLGQPLVDFSFVKANEGGRVRTVEHERSGKYLVAEYKWRKFGLEFTRYITREINYDIALALLKQ